MTRYKGIGFSVSSRFAPSFSRTKYHQADAPAGLTRFFPSAPAWNFRELFEPIYDSGVNL